MFYGRALGEGGRESQCFMEELWVREGERVSVLWKSFG